MEQSELQRAIEAILFAAGERIEVSRLATALEADPKDIIKAADALMDALSYERRGIRILKLSSHSVPCRPEHRRHRQRDLAAGRRRRGGLWL